MRARMYETRLKDTFDRVVFLGTFVVGIVGTVVLKIGFGSANAVLLAAFPVAVLSLYAIYCAISRANTIEPETAGDNCYYLGFLFTLSSLALTLYRVNSAGGAAGEVLDIAEVISGFGIALSSTIAGVLLRVLFFQMRPDLVAADREARTELSQSVREFRRQVTQITREMKSLSTEFGQHVAERNSKMFDIIENQQNKSDEDLRMRLIAIATAFEAMPVQLSEKFAVGVRTGVEGATSSVTEAVNGLRSSLDDLVMLQETGATTLRESGTALEQALDQFTVSVQSFKGGLDAGAASISEVSEKLSQSQEMIDKIITKLERRVVDIVENEPRSWWVALLGKKR